MADETKKPEDNLRGFNPKREALRKAADDLLKADRAARRRAAAEDADAFAEFGEHDDATGDEAPAYGSAQDILAEEIKAIQDENADMKDRLLRLAADMENLRSRTKREVADAKSYAVANFARDMLAVNDNLRRALEAVTEDQRAAAGDAFKTLLEGVEMTERSMISTLERYGVQKLEPEGERFDPNFHQAMFEIPNTEVPNNTVMQVVQTGYSIGERVLRPAMVGVSKGGPKAAPQPKGEQDTPAEPGPPNEQAEKDA